MSKIQRKESSSSSSSSASGIVDDNNILVMKSEVIALDGAWDTEYEDVKRSTRHITPTCVPPLAIYHICRVCLRTRSPRYHRDHPIPVDGVPPPPGICRRCRVMSVEETTKKDYVVEHRSNEVKLGCFAPFMKDDAFVSNDEMRQIKLERFLREQPGHVVISRQVKGVRERSGSRRRDISYRHVRVTEVSEDDSASEAELEKTKVVFVQRECGSEPHDTTSERKAKVSAQATEGRTSSPIEAIKSTSSAASAAAKSSNMLKLDSSKASVSAEVSSASSHSRSRSTARASATVTTSRPGRSNSEIRKIAREEIEAYAQRFQRPERSESEVRRISREEVERYRTAERKLEAHPDAFAHGRLVPVERRIEIEKDEPAQMPWQQPAVEKDATATAAFSAKVSRRSTNAWEEAEQDDLAVSVRTRRSQDSAAAPSQAPPASVQSGSRKTMRDEGSASWAKTETDTGKERLEVNGQDWQYQADGQVEPSRQSGSNAPSWGPRWRRELSMERRQSVHSGAHESRASKATRTSKISSKFEATASSELPSVKLREVYDEVQESDPPRWSSRAEPYVRHAARAPRKEMYDVIEVIEEVELPPKRPASYRRAPASERSSTKQQPAAHETKIVYVHREEVAQRSNSAHNTASRTSRRTDDKQEEAYVRSHTSNQDVKSHVASASRHSVAAELSWDAKQSEQEPTSERYGPPSNPASDQTRWSKDQNTLNASQVAAKGSDSQSTGRRSAVTLPYPEEDVMPDHDSSIAQSARRSSARPARSDGRKRSSRPDNSDVEYIYTERIVTPVGRPWGWRPPHSEVEVEAEILHRRGSRKEDASSR